jgi:hypothetical protein
MLSQIITHHNKRAILFSFTGQARTICDSDSLDIEMHHLRKIFQQNGYGIRELHCAFHSEQKLKTPRSKPAGMAIITIYAVS